MVKKIATFDVADLGLGGMPLSLPGRPSREQAYAVIDAFVDGGGDFIDSANVYCLGSDDVGHNERLIADALARRADGDSILVASKGGLIRPRGRWDVRGDPAFLKQSCAASLVALGREAIDLYQLHAVDPNVPLEDSVGALEDLRREGKIRYIGVSNVDAGQLARACAVAPVVSVQNKCHLLQKRDLHNGVIAHCAKRGIAYIAHSPVGGHMAHGTLATDATVAAIAKAHQATPYQVALAWLLGKGRHIIPIPGATKVASIQSSLAARGLKLHADEVAALDRLPDW